MSQMAPEAPPAAPAPPSPSRGRAGGGNVFTRKIGPLSMWVWLLIGIALIGAYVLWKRNQASQTAQPTANASQVPQFVNQVYTNGVPPTAPQPGTTPTCPKGYAWDPDENKCVKEGKHRKKKRGHKGRDTESPAITGSGVTTINPGGNVPPLPFVPSPGGPTGPFVTPAG